MVTKLNINNIRNKGQVDFAPVFLFDFFYHSIFHQAVSISSMPKELSDPQLMYLLRDGDKTAFTELVNRHANRFYRIAFRFLNNRDNSEDVVQEAFLKLWDNTGLWKPEYDAKFTTWFSKIVINLCLDLKKKNKSSLELVDSEIAGNDETPDVTLSKIQNREILNRCIDEIPERQQTAINLCFYEGFSNKEAAEIMEIHIKALESLLMRAKSGLREKLMKREGI